jgi:hypothetical protein
LIYNKREIISENTNPKPNQSNLATLLSLIISSLSLLFVFTINGILI